MHVRKKLSDILTTSERDSVIRAWETTAAAADFGPLPAGDYKAKLDGAEFFTSKARATPGIKLALVVVEPVEHVGRKLWHDLWLTGPAMPGTKRDLAKIGVTELDQLDGPVPEGIIVAVRVVTRKDDDGSERNRVTRFEFARRETPAPNPFPTADEADNTEEGETPF
jgi:hypothetical protein